MRRFEFDQNIGFFRGVGHEMRRIRIIPTCNLDHNSPVAGCCSSGSTIMSPLSSTKNVWSPNRISKLWKRRMTLKGDLHIALRGTDEISSMISRDATPE